MILVIGYGNPLRTDDAIGQHVAQMMEQRLGDKAIRIQTVYQLTPELVEPIRHAELVIFLDARVGEPPGLLIHEPVEPATGANAFTHHIRPETLLGAAQELYSATPKGILISISGANFEFGSELSPQLRELLPKLADQVEKIVKSNIQAQPKEEIHHA